MHFVISGLAPKYVHQNNIIWVLKQYDRYTDQNLITCSLIPRLTPPHLKTQVLNWTQKSNMWSHLPIQIRKEEGDNDDELYNW